MSFEGPIDHCVLYFLPTLYRYALCHVLATFLL